MPEISSALDMVRSVEPLGVSETVGALSFL